MAIICTARPFASGATQRACTGVRLGGGRIHGRVSVPGCVDGWVLDQAGRCVSVDRWAGGRAGGRAGAGLVLLDGGAQGLVGVGVPAAPEGREGLGVVGRVEVLLMMKMLLTHKIQTQT